MMFRASTNIPSHLLRASYSMCYKPPYFPNINGRNQAGASLRLDNRNSHPNASPKRMFRLSRLAVVSAHAAANTPRFVPLVIPHYLRVVRPVVVIIIGPLVSRRIGTGGDEVSVVRRPGQSVVHLVVVAPVDRVLALTSLNWCTPWAAIHANSLNIHKPFATPGDSVQNRVCILHSMNMLYMHATLACYACIQCMFHCICHSPAHKREKKEQSNLRLGVSGKVHGSSAHGKRGQRSSRISGGWGDRRNFLAEVSELLVGPDAKRDGGLLKKTRHGPRGRHRLSAVA